MDKIRKQVKSVHITNYYHASSGGISTLYNRLIDEANRCRREVRLIVPGEEDGIETRGDFARIYYVKAIRTPVYDRRYRIMLPWQYLPKKAAIRGILEIEKPDVIEIADKYLLGYLAGSIKNGYFKALNRPMLVHLSCERMDDNIRAFVSGARPFRWLSRTVMGNVVAPMYDYHFANSDYTAQELLDAVPNSPNGEAKRKPNALWRYFRSSNNDFANRVRVVNCGVDDVLFSHKRNNPETRRKTLTDAGVPEEAVVLLYAGRISPEKNIKLIERLFRQLLSFRDFDSEKRDFRLLIAGDGPQSEWLKNKLIRNAPGKSKLLGHVDDPEYLADLYASADIFVHPNPREPFGIGPLEAMASGTPVIVPNSGGILSYANPENAWIREPHSESYFQAAMDILNNPEKRERKIRNALETVKKFTWERSMRRNFGLYDELYAEFRQEFKVNGDELTTTPAGMEIDEPELSVPG